jgi:pyruvate-formate lyase-activating enzyme
MEPSVLEALCEAADGFMFDLKAFDNEVAAQAGKALTFDQSKLLTTFAAAL